MQGISPLTEDAFYALKRSTFITYKIWKAYFSRLEMIITYLKLGRFAYIKGKSQRNIPGTDGDLKKIFGEVHVSMIIITISAG